MSTNRRTRLVAVGERANRILQSRASRRSGRARGSRDDRRRSDDGTRQGAIALHDKDAGQLAHHVRRSARRSRARARRPRRASRPRGRPVRPRRLGPVRTPCSAELRIAHAITSSRPVLRKPRRRFDRRGAVHEGDVRAGIVNGVLGGRDIGHRFAAEGAAERSQQHDERRPAGQAAQRRVGGQIDDA